MDSRNDRSPVEMFNRIASTPTANDRARARRVRRGAHLMLLTSIVSTAALSCASENAPPPAAPSQAAPPPPPPSPASPPPSVPVATNPFFDASPLLYEAPPFDKIHDSDYEPARLETPYPLRYFRLP